MSKPKLSYLKTLLTISTSIGVAVSSILSYKAGKKAAANETTYVVPATIATACTIAGVVSVSMIGTRQKKSMASAYMMLHSLHKAYQDKVKDKCGEEFHDEIMAEIAEDVYISSPGLIGSETLDFNDKDPNEKRVFYDHYSGRYFESTKDKVLQAEYHLNRNYALNGSACVNDFYEFLGISDAEGGDDVGWTIDEGIYWIDFDHDKVILETGLEVLTIDMVFEPMLFEQFYI